jgi:hypothetical protein
MARRLDLAITVFLWGALALDLSLFAMTWVSPDLWFQAFHGTNPEDPEAVAFLRRCGGHWLAFSLIQAITLWKWRDDRRWLLVLCGVRASDVFTDLSYVLASEHLTALGWACLLPPPLFNATGAALGWIGYAQRGD